MSLTSYRAAPPRGSARRARESEISRNRTEEQFWLRFLILVSSLEEASVLCRPGDDLLSHVLRQSTIGAEAFDGRVRDGIGSYRLAEATRPAKDGVEAKLAFWRSQKRIETRSSERAFARALFLASDFWFLASARLRALSDNENNQAERAISTGKLRALPRFHIRPIDVVVFHGSSGRNRLEAGFPLRCLQRLSIPYIATLHCGWRHNRSTRDTFTPVLSY